VPELTRPDGARIHYESQGEGPTVLLASYWSWGPQIYDGLLAELARDHEVVRYHLRGTGQSSRQGPYGMETDLGDLEAVVEAAGPPALLLAIADGANRAVRLAARRPQLVDAVVCFGAAPFARAALRGEEGMAGSDTVIDAFKDVIRDNYRGALSNFLGATNPQASEQELRERVHAQAEFSPVEAALPRITDWLDDDPTAEARALGERLWVFAAHGVAGPWLPPPEVLRRLTAENMPDANVIEIAEDAGPISRPQETADAIRRIRAQLRSGAEARK
jgi:pimeloyl-ACP methyl ester carboxylesterase